MSSSGKKTSRTEQYVISYHPTAPTLGGSTYLRDRTIFFERVGPWVIEIRDKRPTVAITMASLKYDLIQLHRQIIHQNDGISMKN